MSLDGTRTEVMVAHDAPEPAGLDASDTAPHALPEEPRARPPVSLYRIFRRGEDGEAASVRSVVLALVVVAALIVATGVIRVARRHEVLRLGYQLSKKSEQVHELREQRRQLELEHATLSAPDRIRRLATQLGMTPVAPDKIRVIGRREVAAR
jgi:cell division protein FtsL